MDCEENIVIDVESDDKREEKVSSNMLESRAAKKTFDRINKKYGPDSLEVLTTDGDNKTFNQCKKAKLKAKKQFDARHGIRSINRNFPTLASSVDYDDNFPDVLDGQQSRIVSLGVYLIENIDDEELRGLNLNSKYGYLFL